MFGLFGGKPSVSIYGLTHIGCVRQNNEDNFTICSKGRVAVAADGMGGYACGEVASQIAVKTFFDGQHEPELQSLPKANGDTIRRWLLGKIEEANENVVRDQNTSRVRARMGSTIVAMCYFNDEVHIAHAGDSRAYVLRNTGLFQLTRDHSLVEEAFRKGYLTRRQADASSNRNVVTRVLGLDHKIEPDHVAFVPQAGNVLLLCTDGLCGVVPDGVIGDVLATATKRNLSAICSQLVDLALSHGGPDNVTVVVAVFH